MVKLYRKLLRLFPASFRAEYQSELESTFEEANRGRGRVGGALAAVGDAVPNALLAHWSIFRQDLRYALRTLSRSRGFALTVVLVTAIGVGANTATFSVADYVLLRPLPFPDPNALVRLCEGPKEGGGWGCMNELSPGNYRSVASTRTAVQGWGAFTGASVNLVGAGRPLRLEGISVSAQVFPTLGVAPLLGRVFDTTGTRDRDARSVVLSYGLWRSQFGADRGVLGKTVRLDDASYTVIGVMPPGFRFPGPGVQLWTWLNLRETDFLDRGNTYLQAVGRLREGATFEQAQADLALLFARLQKDFPESNAETGFSFFRQRDYVMPRFRLMLLALCGASLSLLLVTSANLANLLLARAAARERELAVRAALGAGRDRLVRQMLTESVLLALLGGAAGILVAGFTVPLLAHLIPTSLPVGEAPRLDLTILALAGGFTLLTGIGFGLLPALRAGGRTGLGALQAGARAGGGRRQRLRTVLVTLEVALSIALLIPAGLLIRAVLKVEAVDPGFRTEDVLTVRTALATPRADNRVRREEFYQRVLDEVRALPGVTAAGYTSGIPMIMWGGVTGIEIPGEPVRPRRSSPVSIRWVTPGYLETLGLPVLSGRELDETDRGGAPLVAVVSESFAKRYWPGRDAIGMRFRTWNQERAVIGVVSDIRVRGLERSSEPQLYVPIAQAPDTIGDFYAPKDLALRAPGRAAGLAAAVKEIVARVDAEQPVSDVRLLSEVVEAQTVGRRAQLQVLGALAAVALLLTGIGIHGLLAFMVAQRSREIGVRLALGAEPKRVGRMIVGEAARLALFGGLPGVLAAYLAARGMSALLFGIEPADPLTLGAAVLLVLLVTLAGALIPAIRAVRTNPLVAMRAE
jgi:putative ABC transport system permease protein